MIEKKDWVKVLEDNKAELVKIEKQYELAIPQFNAVISAVEAKIAEFPDDDPMPEEVKEVVEAAK